MICMNIYEGIKNKKLFLFDVDGVIKLSDTLIEGAIELYNYIDSIGGKSIFITNNSTMSNDDYVNYFKNKGFGVDESNFITALSLTLNYLKENHNNDYIYVVGTNSLFKELKDNNLNVTSEYDDNVTLLLVAFDNELNFKKVEDACKLLQTKDITYLATNLDLRCPVDFGFIPDCGAIVNMIENATNKMPLFLGKPSKKVVEVSLEITGFTKEETLVIGDRLYTDIACGINANVDTCLVLTGEAKESDLMNSKIKPTYIFKSVKELLHEIKK